MAASTDIPLNYNIVELSPKSGIASEYETPTRGFSERRRTVQGQFDFMASRVAAPMIAEALSVGALGPVTVRFPWLAQFAARAPVARPSSSMMHANSTCDPGRIY
jgi:hypothetical protein